MVPAGHGPHLLAMKTQRQKPLMRGEQLMMFKMDGFKRVLSVGALALATTTLAFGAPKAQARVDVGIGLGVPPVVVAPPPVVVAPPPVVVAPAPAVVAPPTVVAPYAMVEPPVVGGVNLDFGFDGGHGGWRDDRGWHGHGRERR
jgi:hypothetical protein